jgi:hypothetical protein
LEKIAGTSAMDGGSPQVEPLETHHLPLTTYH